MNECLALLMAEFLQNNFLSSELKSKYIKESSQFYFSTGKKQLNEGCNRSGSGLITP